MAVPPVKLLEESKQMEIARKALWLVSQEDSFSDFMTKPDLSCLEYIETELWKVLSSKGGLSKEAVTAYLLELYPTLKRYQKVLDTLVYMADGNAIFANLYANAALYLSYFLTEKMEDQIRKTGWSMKIVEGQDLVRMGKKMINFRVKYTAKEGALEIPPDTQIRFLSFGNDRVIGSFSMEGKTEWEGFCSFEENGQYYITVVSDSKRIVFTRFKPFYVSTPAKEGCDTKAYRKAMSCDPAIFVEVFYDRGYLLVHATKLSDYYKEAQLEFYTYFDFSNTKRHLFYIPVFFGPMEAVVPKYNSTSIILDAFYKQGLGGKVLQVRMVNHARHDDNHTLFSSSPFTLLEMK